MSDPAEPTRPPGQPAPPPAGPAFGPYAGTGQTSWAPTAGTPTFGPPPRPGQSPPQSNTIHNYAAPRARTSVVVLVLAIACLIGVVAAAALLRRSGAPVTADSPSPSATASLPGMPFSMPRDSASTGRWEVVGRRWDSSGVNVHVRVTAVTGLVTYGFQAFAKGSSTPTRPIAGTVEPALDTGDLEAGQVADGWIYLEIPHAESTLFLTTRDGRAISALPIKA